MPAIAAMALGTTDVGVVNSLATSATLAGSALFSPDGFTPNGAARFVDRSGGIPAAYPSVTLHMRPPSSGNRNYKMTVTCTRPTLETLGTSSQSGYLPGQKVGYSGVARIEFVMPERMTLAERKALYALLVSTLATNLQASDADPTVATGSPVQTMVQNLEAIY